MMTHHIAWPCGEISLEQTYVQKGENSHELILLKYENVNFLSLSSKDLLFNALCCSTERLLAFRSA